MSVEFSAFSVTCSPSSPGQGSTTGTATGSSMSFTMTVNVVVHAALPAVSVTVRVTGNEPAMSNGATAPSCVSVTEVAVPSKNTHE